MQEKQKGESEKIEQERKREQEKTLKQNILHNEHRENRDKNMSNEGNTPTEGVTEADLTIASDSLSMSALNSGARRTEGPAALSSGEGLGGSTSLSSAGIGPRLSIGANPILQSVSKPGLFSGGNDMPYNSQQQGFHRFWKQSLCRTPLSPTIPTQFVHLVDK